MAGEVEGWVECYSGHEYAERPLAFEWRGERMVVESVLQQQITPEGKRFYVQTPGGDRFWLDYDQAADRWGITPG